MTSHRPTADPTPDRTTTDPLDWRGRLVVVAGTGVSGAAAARALARLGADVVAVDDRADDGAHERAERLRADGLEVRLGGTTLHPSTSLVVSSPGIRPTAPLLVAAAAAGVETWGEAELAWRLRAQGAAPWLVVTGTNGKTTTVRMLAAILVADGRRAVAAGNVGTPLVEVVTAADPVDLVAVELSSFQLATSSSIAPLAAVVLNVAPDHLDWHGTHDAYAAAKAVAYERAGTAVVPLDEPSVVAMAERATLAPGGRTVGVTSLVPPPGAVGLVDDLLVDRAFVDDPVHAAEELATTGDLFADAPHVVADALAAAALGRAAGVSTSAVRDGLHGFRPDPHRIAVVATHDGITWVDDSKATNPHAALASLSAYAPVVWVAGGLAKGADFDDLVRSVAPRLRAAVLIGRDRDAIADALRRHAPQVPVVDLASTDTEVMEDVVAAAADAAEPGDTVLLAPGCASWDMFADYGARGDAFAAAVRRRSQGDRLGGRR